MPDNHDPSLLSRRQVLKIGGALALSPLARYAKILGLDPSVKYAFFSDTHLSVEKNVAVTRELLDEMARLADPRLAVNIGDVTEYGWSKEYESAKAVFSAQKFRTLQTVGNHDVRWSPLGIQAFEQGFGAKPYLSSDLGPAHLVVLDSTVPLSHWGHFESAQLRWLAADLKRVGRERPVFLFFHHPVGIDTFYVDNEEELRRVLEPYNVKILHTGHGHSDRLWYWDQMACTMLKGLYQGSYGTVEIVGGDVIVRRRTKESEGLQDLITVPVKPSRDKRPLWAVPAGRAIVGEDLRGNFDKVTECRWNDGKWTPLSNGRVETKGLKPGFGLLSIRTSSGQVQGSFELKVSDPNSKIKMLWVRKLSGGVMSHLRFEAGKVYISAMDGTMNVLNASNGKVVWKAATQGYSHSSPCLTDRLVIVGSADSFVYAFDKASGKQVWRVKTGGPVYASAAVASGIACIASGDGRFYGIETDTGALRWTYDMPESNTRFAQSAACTDGTRFFLGAWDSHLYAIGLDGGLVWRQPCFPRTFAWSPAIGSPCVADGFVYVPANGNGLFCFDAATGEQKWMVSSKTDKFGHSSPRIAGDRIVVGGLGDLGELLCVSRADGSLLWSAKTGSVIYDSSPCVGDGFAAIGSVNGVLSVADLADGRILGQFRLPTGHFLASPVADGKRIYAASFSDTVVGLEML